MKITSIGALILICGANLAHAMSDQETNLMMASAKAVQTYRQGGMTGLVTGVQQCYDKLIPGKPSAKKDLEFCVAQDISATFIDSSAAQANGFPRNQSFTDAVVANRIHDALMQAGVAKSADDTKKYLAAREGKVRHYTNVAASVEDSPKKADGTEACVQKKLAAWSKQWLKDLDKYCTSLIKRGEECRVSAGQEEVQKQAAIEQFSVACQRSSNKR